MNICFHVFCTNQKIAFSGRDRGKGIHVVVAFLLPFVHVWVTGIYMSTRKPYGGVPIGFWATLGYFSQACTQGTATWCPTPTPYPRVPWYMLPHA